MAELDADGGTSAACPTSQSLAVRSRRAVETAIAETAAHAGENKLADEEDLVVHGTTASEQMAVPD